MRIALPSPCLVVLMGASGSGKSTFAARHFLPTEVVSSDVCRALVSDDANDQAATTDAFAVLHEIVSRRLARGRLTVVDATNVQRDSRAGLLRLARAHDLFAIAIALDEREPVCLERNALRPDRDFGAHVVRRQRKALHQSLRGLRKEGFQDVWVLRDGEDAVFTREPLWTDRSAERGPFDVIGDVHGCIDELRALLARLGYVDGRHPDGRRAVFVGDYVDRGPASGDVLRLVMEMAEAGSALCFPGNHDDKLVRKLRGRDVRIAHGLAETLEQLDREPEDFVAAAREFLAGLVSHAVLDGGALVVAHAGMPERYQGRASKRVREFAFYGDTTGETDQFGLPVRGDWAADYRGPAAVVYGHTPVPDAQWVNGTINIDTGCVFGGALTALRWPERELVSVPAAREYYAPARPLKAPDRPRDLLDVEDVAGKRIVQTRLARSLTIGAEQAAVVCHSDGSERFGIEGAGAIYTRTGRPFFDDAEPALARLRAAISSAGLWESLDTDWLVLDCEILPWSAKAKELIERQYAAVGAAAQASLSATMTALEAAAARGLDVAALLEETRERAQRVDRYVDTYSHFGASGDVQIAPFHVLAGEQGAYGDRDHAWHLRYCDALAAADPGWIRRTDRRHVDLTDPAGEAEATAWWEALTEAGGEGMVVKPLAFTATGRRGLLQPSVKVRGREYLRIIYGPEYDAPGQLDRLRSRGLGRKRSLATREFALGFEALERFVRREPLYRVHECVFAVLALESDPVDPRL